MPDYNKILDGIQKDSARIEKEIKNLLISYDSLYKDAHHEFNEERVKAGSMDGLEVFYRLINTLRRNRDVVSSMHRATRGLRPLRDFKFIEEEIDRGKLDERKLSRMDIPEEAEQINVPEPVEAASPQIGDDNA